MQKRRAFTLLEVLIVIFVLATGIMVVIQGVNKTTSYISESAQRTIALNLAKEGIEAIYNIRNTNWRKWPAQKDECWLVADPSVVNPSAESCSNDKLDQGRRVLHSQKVGNNDNSQRLYYLTKVEEGDKWEEDSNNFSNSQNFKNWLNTNNFSYPGEEKLIQNPLENGSYNYYLPYLTGIGRVSQPEFATLKSTDSNFKDNRKLGEYRRYLSFASPQKKVENCTEKCAQELRFCSIVFYTAPHQWIVKICSMMTNFEKSSSEV